MSCKFELEHIGINQANADEAAKLAEQLSGMFNLAPKHGNKSEFAGPYFECMKSPFLGTNGHIAMRTPDLAAAMEELKEKRVSKQPLEYGSAGSTFKRPEGYFAGKLIEDAGLRGFRVGDAQVSEKHCGFVINRGAATAAEVVQLMDQVRMRVKEKFGVDLEPEGKRIGEF